jgi:two-component system sensor histidine kinase AlgZ
MTTNQTLKGRWLTDFCDNKQIFVSVVMIQIVVIIYALSSLSFNFAFLYSLSVLTLLAQFIGMTLVILLCKLRHWLNQFNVVTGVLLVIAIVVLQTSFISQLIGFLELQLSLQLITGDESINHINLKLSLSSVIICLALIRYFYIQDQWHQQIEKLADARLIALQARIKPHFLFNSLNSIAALIGVDTEKAEVAIADFSDLMRRTFSHKDKFITIKDELKWVEQYLAIEKLRLDKRLQYQINCDPKLLNYKIPILCIQPLVENSIIHGLQPLEKGGKIDIKISDANSILMIEVQNPFIEVNIKSNPSNSNQMALQNIHERLKLHYGNKATIQIDKSNNIYTVTVSIPL